MVETRIGDTFKLPSGRVVVIEGSQVGDLWSCRYLNPEKSKTWMRSTQAEVSLRSDWLHKYGKRLP